MAGMEADTPIPSDIRLHRKSRMVELCYDSGERFELSCEFLRVFTPSAEARGHGPGQETLQTGKRDVDIERVEPVGTYALRFIFSDGHDSGLYSWDLLYNLGRHRDELWQEYLGLIERHGLSRDEDTTSAARGGACGHHH
jgi:DUF971 family protein